MPTAVKTSNRTTRKSGALREAREQLYRQHILAVAEQRFADAGFAATRMQDIAQQAEISLTTLYQQYPGKQNLYRAILVERDREMLASVVTATQQLLGQAGKLEPVLQLMATQVGFLLDHPAYLRMQLQDGLLWFHSTSRPSDDEQQLWEQGLALIEKLFEWGMREGIFRPAQPIELGRLLLSLQQTRLANWVLGDMQVGHQQVIAQVQEDFVRLFCVPAVIMDYLRD